MQFPVLLGSLGVGSFVWGEGEGFTPQGQRLESDSEDHFGLYVFLRREPIRRNGGGCRLPQGGVMHFKPHAPYFENSSC